MRQKAQAAKVEEPLSPPQKDLCEDVSSSNEAAPVLIATLLRVDG